MNPSTIAKILGIKTTPKCKQSLLFKTCWSYLLRLSFQNGNSIKPNSEYMGGYSTFFQVGCAAWISKVWGLWTDIYLWKRGLVSWKCSNLGAWELKFGQKLRMQWLKFPNFLKRGSCELTLLPWNGTLANYRTGMKRDLQGCTSPYPLSRSVPPRIHMKQSWQIN